MPDVLPAEQGGSARSRAPLRIEVREADQATAEIGSSILCKAWQGPSLHYTPEFVRFQTGYPSSLDSFAVLAWSGDDPVAFVAAMSRESTLGPIYVSSLFCALPGYGAVAPGIVRRENTVLKKAGVPWLVFAASGSTGESIIWAAGVFGRPQSQIGSYRIHMAASRPMPDGFEVIEVAPDEWCMHAEELRPKDAGLLSPVFTPATLEHMDRDPQGRRFLIAKTQGAIAGAAILSHTHNRLPDGSIQILPTLNYVRLGDGRPDVLSALISSAGGPLVTIPNTTGITPEVLKGARARATPASFVAVLAGAPEGITATDFEII